MKLLSKVALGAAAATAILSAGSAQAAITLVSSVGGVGYDYAADRASVPDTALICDFQGAAECTDGYTFTPTAPASDDVTLPDAGSYTAPPGAALTDEYAAVLGNSIATLTSATPLTSFSFFFGSPDSYNWLTFMKDGAFVKHYIGSQLTNAIAYAQGANANVGYRVTFSIDEADGINGVRWYSSQDAFEFDRISVAVPEPATWAMMLMGFFGLGGVVRSRRSKSALAAA